MQAQRHPSAIRFGEAAGYADARNTSEISVYGVNIVEIHFERVIRLFTELEGRPRGGGAENRIAIFKRPIKVTFDESADLQSAQVIGIVIAARKGVGAQHDPSFNFGAETLSS